MKVLLDYCENQIIIKNSRFISEAFVVTSAKEAREKLQEQKKKFFDATHVVHAFVTGLKAEVTGMSDDGEPSGTAGRPVLDVLKGSGITNIMVTVTRYFGGTLLGTGGLVRAYGDSCKELLALCKTEEYVKKARFFFAADYSSYSGIQRMFDTYHISELKEDYGDGIIISGLIWEQEKEAFALQVKNFSKGKIDISYTEL
jgi:uncharacterized YigZ family protein